MIIIRKDKRHFISLFQQNKYLTARLKVEVHKNMGYDLAIRFGFY